ncbi:MAG TPA: PAS domain S-box protein [Bryobacteraceae bacterium]|nr:PAS domain S-box protein [Bryobacteraceae bacterium]
MGDFFSRLFSSDYMPHGHCFFWQPSLVWLHVISDSFIAAAYFSIPVTLYYFIRKRPDVKLRGVILMFAAFIMACGMTHLLSVWDIWHSAYRLEGVVKAITASLSVATALVAIRLGPVVAKIASPEQLEEVNEKLRVEIEGRDQAEEKLRRYVQAELLASEDKLHSFFEAASQGILGVASDGCITLVNRRTEELFGYSRAELLGQSLEILLPERFRAGHVAHRSGYFAQPRMRTMGAGMDLAGLRKDGTEFPIEIGLSHVNTPEGRQAFGMVSDISERRKVEAELLASEDKLRSLFDAAPEGILGVSADGTISMVNRRTAEMFGYERSELLGQKVELLLPERFRTAHVMHREAYLAEPRMRAMGAGMDLAGRRKDGTEFPLEIGLSHVNTPEGQLAFGMVSDISERKKAADELERLNNELLRSNAELSASEGKFRSCLEAASQAIIGFGADGRISLVNRQTEEMFRYSRGELLGQPLAMLYPERGLPGLQARLKHAFVDPHHFLAEDESGQELIFRRKDGSEFPFSAGVSKVDLPEGPLVFGMINDISESKKADDDLKRVNAELRRSYTEMEQFAHVASHDLQEPLRMVTGYLQLVERRYAPQLDADGREFIGFAVDGARRMKALIRDLLDFSRAGTGAANFREVEATSLLGDALRNLKIAIDESAAMITADPLPTIYGDRVLLTQVLQNLIANALKFQKGTAPCVHVSARREGKEWIFSIRDNGIGIESRHLDRIFRIFERLHSIEEYSGSGIGLAITRKIVERHGGTIWVESQPGSGSTFYFSISAETGTLSEGSKLGMGATT